MSVNEIDSGELNAAIWLYQQRRLGEARASLRSILERDPGNITAWNVLGYLQGDIGEVADAAEAFDRALRLDPRDPIALKGRARMALERAEPDVLNRYRAALAVVPGDPQLLMEATEARITSEDAEAIDEFAEVVRKWPQWTDGQIAFARMRWETLRDAHFTDQIEALLAAEPRRLDLWHAYIDLLVSSDRHLQAADAARDACAAVGSTPDLALIEAAQAGWAGDIDRAEALFEALPPDLPGRPVQEGIHFVRQGKLERAHSSIEIAISENPDDMGGWAIAELLWRKLGDPRSAWLSNREGLVRTFDLALGPDQFEAIKMLLLDLHHTGVQMVGQSIRGGTQTRWRLFDRPEPELAELKHALNQAIADYVAGLPPVDQRHPLLRHRDDTMTMTGSWSVRLTSGGRHVSHVHPLGLISSASYFIVPQGSEGDGEGSLELGCVRSDLNLDLAPLHVITPKPGQLTLFPSYLHHGTTSFTAGERLAVAFDVNLHPAPDV